MKPKITLHAFRTKLSFILTIGCLFLNVVGVSAQENKPKMPSIPQKIKHSIRTLDALDDNLPYGYTRVGTTYLCSRQMVSSIDIQGYYNNYWYQSTYSNVGYKVALSVSVSKDEEIDVFGLYQMNSWTGYENYWYDDVFEGKEYVGLDSFPMTLTLLEDNEVILDNFVPWGGALKGIIDREKRTITFPAQTYCGTEWGVDVIFCKQTPEILQNPEEAYATEEVVAYYDMNFNITMEGWCELLIYEKEKFLFTDNRISYTREVLSGDSAISCNDGGTYNGVTFHSYVEQQGDVARMCYSLHNTNDYDVVISMGTHADVMIGSNDSAPIERRKDLIGNTYGLTMKDGYGAQLCVLFGAGLAGVTKVDDFWFGEYYQNYEPYNMIGNYYQGNYWMQENGSYDSGMGWCWKNRKISAGETVIFSYLIGVGEVNLEPNLSFEVTPEDVEGWNDLSRPHKLTLNGKYESPVGIDGIIEYAVEGSHQWIVLTDTLSSGEEFIAELIAMFDPEKSVHKIDFRTVDVVGNTTLLNPIIYKDVAFHQVTGIENKIYSYGDSIYQTNLTCDLPQTEYVINDYRNNVNAGTATFSIQGIFPVSIGRKVYSFEIAPAEIEGDIQLVENKFVYNGQAHKPQWQFTDERNNALVQDTDYSVKYTDNIYPGVGMVEVVGKNNFKGSFSASFTIDKAPLTENQYDFTLPNEDISYDGQPHSAAVAVAEGVGDVKIAYVETENNTISEEAPINAGSYDIYAEIAEGSCYYGKESHKIGSFSIFKFDENEWNAIGVLATQLQTSGWTPSWDIAAGPVAVSKFEGLTIQKGHVVAFTLTEKGLTEIPTGLVAFTQLETLNLSHNCLEGNAALIPSQLPNLKSLDLSYNCIADLYPSISPKVTWLDLSHQTIDRTVELNLSTAKLAEMAMQIPTILIYDHKNQTLNTNINLLCTTGQTSQVLAEDWAMELAIRNGSLGIPYVSENNDYHGQSGDILNVFHTKSQSSFKLKLNFDQGDANFLNGVDATDLQATILFAFGGYRNYPFNFTAADTYADGIINIQDVVCTVNLILAQLTTEAPAKVNSSELQLFDMFDFDEFDEVDEVEAEATISFEDGNIILTSAKPVAAISVKATGNISWCFDNHGLSQTLKGANAVGYSLSGATIPSGQTVIGSYVGEVSIGNMSLADVEAQNIKVSIGDNHTTGLEINLNDMNELIDSDIEIYDITGRRVNSLGSGVNIIRKGNKTIKIVGGVKR